MPEKSKRGCQCKEQVSMEEERLAIRDFVISAKAHIKEGDTFYLVTQKWWLQWLEYVNQDPTNNIGVSILSEYYDSVSSSDVKRPSVIDNSDLVYGMTFKVHDGN